LFSQGRFIAHTFKGMKNLFILLLTVLFAIDSFTQNSAKLVSKINKIVKDIDKNERIAKYFHYDTVELELFGETEIRIVKFEVAKGKAGEILKITTEEQGYVKLKESYYYQNNKTIKAVISWASPEKTQWDSEIFYENDKAIAQIHRADPLNPEAFLQMANQYLKEQSSQ
jgi:hypothetical protein